MWVHVGVCLNVFQSEHRNTLMDKYREAAWFSGQRTGSTVQKIWVCIHSQQKVLPWIPWSHCLKQEELLLTTWPEQVFPMWTHMCQIYNFLFPILDWNFLPVSPLAGYYRAYSLSEVPNFPMWVSAPNYISHSPQFGDPGSNPLLPLFGSTPFGVNLYLTSELIFSLFVYLPTNSFFLF